MFIAAPEHMRYELLSSTFSSVFTPEEETILAGEIAQGAWNGKTVRLERLLKEADTLTLGLAPSRYFGLLSTNLLVSRDVSGWTPAMQALAARLKQKAAALSLAEDPLQILSCPFLANDLAVSVLVHDGKGRCLLAERSGAVAIAPRTFSVSVTGALDERDLEAEDPIRSCAARECAEELGAAIPEDAFHLFGIFIGERKLQPIALIEAVLPSFEGISQNFETRRFLMVPKEELDSFCGLPMSEAARFQLNLFQKREA
ncbi:MAG: NUDIX domain-containing protein [Olsenella sp.]|jgi:8-oxo-dGTP pyrophosphatase MutT (NUDIX family)